MQKGSEWRSLKGVTLSFIVLFFLAACGAASVCPDGSVTYAADDFTFPAAPEPPAEDAAPLQVEIAGKTRSVDQVITGPLCNANLQGTVYVACDIQVKEWTGKPYFLDGCDFNVAADTVIYVAAHNDDAYYKGCAACHASETAQP